MKEKETQDNVQRKGCRKSLVDLLEERDEEEALNDNSEKAMDEVTAGVLVEVQRVTLDENEV